MKKKNDMARECAKLLKKQGKAIAIEDVPEYALKFLLRHLTRNKSTGRPPHTGRFSGIMPSMDWSDIRRRFEGDQFTTRILDLFEMASQQRPAKPKQLRAVRQAEQAAMSEAERGQRMQKRDAAREAYERFFEHNPLPRDLEGDERKQEINKRLANFSLTPAGKEHKEKMQKRLANFLLTPAGNFTDAMASDIYAALEKHELRAVRFAKKGNDKTQASEKERKPSLMVEGTQFASKERAMERIHDIAKRLHFELRKEH